MKGNSCPIQTFQKFEFTALGSLFLCIYGEKKLVKKKQKLQLIILPWIKGKKKKTHTYTHTHTYISIHTHIHTNKNEIKICVIIVTINFSS